MPLPSNITGISGNVADVSMNGELYVKRKNNDIVGLADLLVIKSTQVYNIFEPIPNKRFIITGISITGDASIGSFETVVHIYEAESATADTYTNLLYQDVIEGGGRVALTSLNLISSEGSYINAYTETQPEVYITILGYYEDV